MKTVTDNFLKEIQKPSWFPVHRVYMLDINGVEVEITKRIARMDRLLWQIEQQFRINEFVGSNCRIDVKNEDEEFDIDNASNFFVTELNRPQDGYKTPVTIKCGYKLDGTEELVDMFYGLIVDADISTEDDIISFDLQCVSRLLMDADTDDMGNQWTDQQIYGGSVHCYLDGAIDPTDKSIIVKNVPTGQFPSGFPPVGYIEIASSIGYVTDVDFGAETTEKKTQIEYEIIHYSQLNANSFEGCLRGAFGTKAATHLDNTIVKILLLDGNNTGDTKFSFLLPPISKNSVSAISSSDGNISLVEERNFLVTLFPKTTGWIDYENGILELAEAPTDPTSLIATYKTAYRQLSYHGIVKKLLINKGFNISLVEDIVLWDYLRRRVSTTYGQITHANDGGTPTLLKLNASINAICIGSADDLLYLGVENSIIQWDGEQFNLIASLPNADDTIVRLAAHSNGKFYGVYGDKYFYSNKTVFEYDGSFIDIATIAEYIDPRPVFGYYGGQWRNFSVDETNGVVWFLYSDPATSGRGIAKVNFDGTGLTLYSRPAKIDVAPYLTAHWMDFVDVGNTIEFFYTYSITGDLTYDMLTKATGVWANNGVITMPYTNLAPVDVVYHPTEDRIYLNAVSTYGYLISVPRGSNIKTQLLEYDWYAIGHRGRICGMVYYPYDGYIYGIRGDENARGDVGAAGDSATGHIYRIKNNVAEDMGNHSERLDLSGFVLGSSAVMAYRESDDALFFISTDYDMQDDPDYGYQLFRYSPQLATIIQLVDIDGRKVWDVLSELAILVNYELGVTGDGKVFWRRRHAGVTYLNGNHNDTVTTINTDGTGMTDFETAGIIQIDQEPIYHAGKTSSSFTACTRGYKGSTAAAHTNSTVILEIHQILQNQPLEKNLKYAKKLPNWDEIYNYIEVPYGDLKVHFDYALAGETYVGSSEQKYGRRSMTISNQFLTTRDALIAMACGWRYYDWYHQRTSLLEIETKWQPQLELGDIISIKQPFRAIFNYVVARIRRIELSLEKCYLQITAVHRIDPYLETIYS